MRTNKLTPHDHKSAMEPWHPLIFNDFPVQHNSELHMWYVTIHQSSETKALLIPLSCIGPNPEGDSVPQNPDRKHFGYHQPYILSKK